jgi:hypothetical protein
MIVPMLLTRCNLKVQINLRLLPGSERRTSVIKEGLPLRVACIDFNLCVFMIEMLKTMFCRKFWTTKYFWDNVDYVNIYIFLDII